MAFVNSIENAPSAPVTVVASLPPACMTYAPAIGLTPSVTRPVTMNVGGSGSPPPVPTTIPDDVELDAELATGAAPPPPDVADPPAPVPAGAASEHAPIAPAATAPRAS